MTAAISQWYSYRNQRQKQWRSFKVKAYHALMDTQFDSKVVKLHSDRGGEYTGKEFNHLLQKLGIKQSLTAHGTQAQHKGVAERLNHTLNNVVRTVLAASGLPKSLWGYALIYSVHLKNRLPHKALEKTGKATPYEVVHGEKPDMFKMTEFGCKLFVNGDPGDKLDPRASEARYLGPCNRISDRFFVYWPKRGTVTVERNIHFLDGFRVPGGYDCES